MNITSEKHLAATVITLCGELTADDADKFKRNIQEYSNNLESDIILDCTDLGLIDSVGLESLLWFSDELGRNGYKLKFASVSATVQRVFELTRLERVFNTHASIEEAARSLV
jgi:anti-sigma B factor antagonist|tara:strand:- start:698 stop:1033 length:336 start_codon:yes stop_codon:yes gene_type:complete